MEIHEAPSPSIDWHKGRRELVDSFSKQDVGAPDVKEFDWQVPKVTKDGADIGMIIDPNQMDPQVYVKGKVQELDWKAHKYTTKGGGKPRDTEQTVTIHQAEPPARVRVRPVEFGEFPSSTGKSLVAIGEEERIGGRGGYARVAPVEFNADFTDEENRVGPRPGEEPVKRADEDYKDLSDEELVASYKKETAPVIEQTVDEHAEVIKDQRLSLDNFFNFFREANLTNKKDKYSIAENLDSLKQSGVDLELNRQWFNLANILYHARVVPEDEIMQQIRETLSKEDAEAIEKQLYTWVSNLIPPSGDREDMELPEYKNSAGESKTDEKDYEWLKTYQDYFRKHPELGYQVDPSANESEEAPASVYEKIMESPIEETEVSSEQRVLEPKEEAKKRLASLIAEYPGSDLRVNNWLRDKYPGEKVSMFDFGGNELVELLMNAEVSVEEMKALKGALPEDEYDSLLFDQYDDSLIQRLFDKRNEGESQEQDVWAQELLNFNMKERSDFIFQNYRDFKNQPGNERATINEWMEKDEKARAVLDIDRVMVHFFTDLIIDPQPFEKLASMKEIMEPTDYNEILLHLASEILEDQDFGDISPELASYLKEHIGEISKDYIVGFTADLKKAGNISFQDFVDKNYSMRIPGNSIDQVANEFLTNSLPKALLESGLSPVDPEAREFMGALPLQERQVVIDKIKEMRNPK